MILTASLAQARVQRTRHVLPDGRDIWVSPVFPASLEKPDAPMATFVEQIAHTTIPPHFHSVNQFQVIVAGEGTLGKRTVQPWSVHYTNGFTGYGPLCAEAAGMAFFTLRNRFDVGGARYFPAGQAFMQPALRRHHLVGPLVLSSAEALQGHQGETCDTVLTPEDDGLAVWLLRLGPGKGMQTPDPASGGGQYLLVAGGTLLYNDRLLPPLSCLYVSADTGPFLVQSGADGLEVLVLQLPVAEAFVVPPAKRTRTGGQGAAGPGVVWVPQRAAGLQQSAKANPEHVAVVQEGASAIATWREAHPGERLHLEQSDFTGINLRGADLPGARLYDTNFQGADLTGANLQQADMRSAWLVDANLAGARLQQASLVRANLTGARLPWARLYRAHLHGAHLLDADLHEANLQQAYLVSTHLVGADLHGASLERADLHWANLQETNLTEARLSGANLAESVLGHTIFGHTFLHGALALDTCRHQAASSLDLGTLACSGHLPAAFLRGCGWTEALIEHLPEQCQELPGLTCIERTLVFPSACQAVGISLLAYLGALLCQQHAGIPVRCRVEHHGPATRLLLETPPEQHQSVEQTLQAYGRIVAAQDLPADCRLDPVQVNSLQQYLETTAVQICHVRQLVGNVLQDF